MHFLTNSFSTATIGLEIVGVLKKTRGMWFFCEKKGYIKNHNSTIHLKNINRASSFLQGDQRQNELKINEPKPTARKIHKILKSKRNQFANGRRQPRSDVLIEFLKSVGYAF